MGESLRVLVIDDSEDDVALLLRTLRRGGYEVTSAVVDTPSAMHDQLENQKWDVITSDHAMPYFSAPEALALAKENCPDVPFIIVSGEIDLNLAVSLMRDGASDFIQKRELARLVPAIERELREVELRLGQKRAEAEQEALLEIMQGLIVMKDLQEILALVHHSVAKVIYAENFFVVFYNKESGLFEEVYSVDAYDKPAPPSRLEKSITAYIFQTGKPVILTRALFDELAAQGTVELVGADSASWMGVPLKASDETIGVIGVQDYVKSDRYSEADQSFLAYISSQVVLAIQRKQSEGALLESERRYRLITENSADVIWVLDLATGKFSYVSPSVQKMLGYKPEEVLTFTMADLLTPESAVKALQLVQRRLAAFQAGDRSMVVMTDQIDQRHRDGSAVPTEMVTTLAIDAQGRPDEIVGVSRDITKRVQAEQALQSTTQRLIALVENMPIGILFEDSSRHVALANQAFCYLWGIPAPASALIGTDCREAVQASKHLLSDPEGFMQRIADIISEQRLVASEKLHLADGRILERDYIPIPIDNQLSGHLWQYRDITERKVAQAGV